MACANLTWKTGIPQTGGTSRPCDATGNLVCCQCKNNQLLTLWIEVAAPARSKATRKKYPDLFEDGETEM